MIRDGKHIAYCGLNCSSCDAFIATKNNNDKLREKTAKEWTERYGKGKRNRPSVKSEDINCRGCLSDGPIYLYCRQCKIRQCGLEKGIKNCKECKDYRCGQLIKMQKHLF